MQWISRYQAFRYDEARLRALLATAPLEGRTPFESFVLIDLPTPNGDVEVFKVENSPIQTPEIEQQTHTHTYRVANVRDPQRHGRVDMGPNGFNGYIRRGDRSYRISSPPIGSPGSAIVYSSADGEAPLGFQCLTQPRAVTPVLPSALIIDSSGDTLKTYRLAINTTAEFTAEYGGVIGAGNAVVSTINSVNVIFQDDLAIKLNIVYTSCYTNATLDPFTNGDLGLMIVQNQLTCETFVGVANFDVGHVLGSGPESGLAIIQGVGNSPAKAMGASLGSSPFDASVAVHEVGHQFGAHHTFAGTEAQCSTGGTPETAYEPGSGSTAMSYAGRCGSQMIVYDHDTYFHLISLLEITSWRDNPGSGGNAVPNGNVPPTAGAGPDYTVPIGTPIKLTATGSDGNGDSLQFCWELWETGSSATHRSHAPVSSASRFIPPLGDVLLNAPFTWDPMLTARTARFRVTARDYRPGGGGFGWDEMTLTVAGSPFSVTYPNGGEALPGGNQILVRWDPGGSTAALVNIRLSRDGGQSYASVVGTENLVTNTPNDGSELVTLPAIACSTARVFVEAVGNIFYDVSDANFTIMPVLKLQSESPSAGVPISVTVGSTTATWTTPTGDTFPIGTTVKLTAPATANGAPFKWWLKDGSFQTTSPTIENIVMDRCWTLKAVYAGNERTVTVESTPTTGAYVTTSVADKLGKSSGTTNFSLVYEGTRSIRLTTQASLNGKPFTRWTDAQGNNLSSTTSVDVQTDASKTVRAVYASATASINVTSVPSGVYVLVNKADVNGNSNGPAPFSRTYATGDAVTLTAPSVSGMTFNGWWRAGSFATSSFSITETVTSTIGLEARYSSGPSRVLTVNAQPVSGAGFYLNGNYLNTPYQATFANGTNVQLKSATYQGRTFRHWLIDGVATQTDPISLTMNQNHNVVEVLFGADTNLYINSVPIQGVPISLSRLDRNGEGDGVTNFLRIPDEGDWVTLTAPIASGNYVFQKWVYRSIDTFGNIGSWQERATVDLSLLSGYPISTYEINATYAVPNRTLTIQSDNPASGARVDVSPADLNGTAMGYSPFTLGYAGGTVVNLTAEPAVQNKVFDHWEVGGANAGTNPTISVTLNADKVAEVFYRDVPMSVDFAATPSQGVMVTLSVVDLNGYGSGLTPIQRTYAEGTVFQATVPAIVPGYRFIQWLQDGSPTSSNVSITILAGQGSSFFAEYRRTYELTVESLPISGVQVMTTTDLNGNGGDLTTFHRTYDVDTHVSLNPTAQVSQGGVRYLYDHREKDGVPTTAPLIMDADQTATLVYVPGYVLTVQSTPTPIPIKVWTRDYYNRNDGTTQFTRTYKSGVTASLTAPVISGTKAFDHWEKNGVPIGTARTINVPMTADTTVKAVYKDAFTLTFTAGNASAVPITVYQADVNALKNGTTDFTRLYLSGASVSFTAPRVVGTKYFARWEKNGLVLSTNATVTVSVTNHANYKAVYNDGAVLTVDSETPSSGVPITVWTRDRAGLANGTTTFTRLYTLGQSVSMTAPASMNGKAFVCWKIDGTVQPAPSRTITITMSAAKTCTAVYSP